MTNLLSFFRSNLNHSAKAGLLGVAATVLLCGCDATEIAQLQSALQQAAASDPSGTPSPGPSPALPSNNGSTCSYTVSLTYDLGPGIDVSQSFEVVASGRHEIPVTELVLQSIATGCPENTVIPAAGVSQQAGAYAIVNENGQVQLYSTPYSQAVLLAVSDPVASLVSPGSMNLSMTPAQVSSGRETQIFDSGSLQSAQGASDALMVLQVTYDYAEPSGNQGSEQPL